MRATVERKEALRLLKIEHQAVEALITELSDEEMTRGDTIRHGMYYDQECSFKDLLAHLICYEVYTVEALREWRAGRKHWAIAAVTDPRRGREIHYGGIAERAHLSLGEQLQEYRGTSQELEAAIGRLSEADWRRDAPYADEGGTDLGGMVEGIMVLPPRPLYRHLPVHVPDARAYIRQPALTCAQSNQPGNRLAPFFTTKAQPLGGSETGSRAHTIYQSPSATANGGLIKKRTQRFGIRCLS